MAISLETLYEEMLHRFDLLHEEITALHQEVIHQRDSDATEKEEVHQSSETDPVERQNKFLERTPCRGHKEEGGARCETMVYSFVGYCDAHQGGERVPPQERPLPIQANTCLALTNQGKGPQCTKLAQEGGEGLCTQHSNLQKRGGAVVTVPSV
jgi:hypothetical protein